MMGSLRLEVITPRGRRVNEGGLTRVVLRRREVHHDPGSQIIVRPRMPRYSYRRPRSIFATHEDRTRT